MNKIFCFFHVLNFVRVADSFPLICYVFWTWSYHKFESKGERFCLSLSQFSNDNDNNNITIIVVVIIIIVNTHLLSKDSNQ